MWKLSPPNGFQALALAAALLAGCAGGKPAPKPPPPPKVTVSPPTRQSVVSYREYTGYLEPKEMVNIRARVRGFLKKVCFEEGAEVAAGTLLYEIDPREFQASLNKVEADLSRAEFELQRAKSEQDRAARTRSSSAISEEEYQQRVTARKVAEAAVNQAKAAVALAQLDLNFTKIHAPIAGKLNRTLVTEGNLVGYNEPTLLTTIVRMDPLYVYFDVPEQYAVEYDRRAREKRQPGRTELSLPVEVEVGTETGYPHHGAINFRENRIDPGTGTIRLRGELPNPDRSLYPGLYARVRVPEGEAKNELLIPEAAVMSDQRGRYVFVVKEDHTVEYRSVTVGTRVGPLIVAEKGLNPNDEVIVNGTQRARPGVVVEAQPAAPAEAGKPQ